MKTQSTTLKSLALWSVILSLTLALLPTTLAQSPQEPNKDQSEPKQNNRTIPETILSEPPPPPVETPQNDKDSIPTFKLNTNLVTFNITVTDPYGRYVTGLSKDHFEVFDDKVPQKIEFFNDDDAPTSVGIIFDVSGSMKGRLTRSFEALNKFCDTSHQLDEYFLVTFNNNAKLAHDFTGDSRNIMGSLSLVDPKGQTALYDAAYIGVEKVRTGRHTRKALLLISDGQDNNSRYSLKELRQLLKESDVQLYAIGITNVFSGRDLDIEGQVILEELTRLTGGRAFFPNNDAELTEVITRIGLELRHQYSIGYEPTNTKTDKRWHKIQVKIKAPKGMPSLSIRTREGYFSQMSSETK
ncbi:MAG: VWA domain-containing protein [Acidobacteria bacterium]|nr:VWA domain-containing protein [Acidobacteriota bacterium]